MSWSFVWILLLVLGTATPAHAEYTFEAFLEAMPDQAEGQWKGVEIRVWRDVAAAELGSRREEKKPAADLIACEVAAGTRAIVGKVPRS